MRKNKSCHTIKEGREKSARPERAESLLSFCEKLEIALSGIPGEPNIPMPLDGYLGVFCNALEAEWGAFIRWEKNDNSGKHLAITHGKYPRKQVIKCFDEIMKVAEKGPEVLETFDWVTNLAIFSLKWGTKRDRQGILMIGGKKKRIAEDLPYYTTEFLKLIQLLINMASELVEPQIRMEYYARKINWEQALYSGSRTAIKKRSREFLDRINAGGLRNDTLRDEVEAALIDAAVSLGIVPSRRPHTGSDKIKHPRF